MKVFSYVIGSKFLEKEFNNSTEAFQSNLIFCDTPHEEKVTFLVTEKELTESELQIIYLVLRNAK